MNCFCSRRSVETALLCILAGRFACEVLEYGEKRCPGTEPCIRSYGLDGDLFVFAHPDGFLRVIDPQLVSVFHEGSMQHLSEDERDMVLGYTECLAEGGDIELLIPVGLVPGNVVVDPLHQQPHRFAYLHFPALI